MNVIVLKFLNTSQTLNIHFKKYILKQNGDSSSQKIQTQYDHLGRLIKSTSTEVTGNVYGLHAVHQAGNRIYRYNNVGNMIERNGDVISYTAMTNVVNMKKFISMSIGT